MATAIRNQVLFRLVALGHRVALVLTVHLLSEPTVHSMLGGKTTPVSWEMAL
jgi:hypothetical protein